MEGFDEAFFGSDAVLSAKLAGIDLAVGGACEEEEDDDKGVRSVEEDSSNPNPNPDADADADAPDDDAAEDSEEEDTGGFKVLLTMDEQAFVEHADGSREWVSLASIGLADLPDDVWRKELAALIEARGVALDLVARDPDLSETSLRSGHKPGAASVVRGLLTGEEVASVFRVAASCLEDGWGTQRRRSVGFPEPGVTHTPSQTHLRLSRHFRTRAPEAWAKICAAVASFDTSCMGGVLKSAAADVQATSDSNPNPNHTHDCTGVDTSFVAEAHKYVDSSFKQADFLVYHNRGGEGASGDWVGWHDHGGESVLFAVMLLSEPGKEFTGGELQYRNLETGEEHTVELGCGDVVVCPSHMEHCVRPISSGIRVSMNIDFWAVGNDCRRSAVDEY